MKCYLLLATIFSCIGCRKDEPYPVSTENRAVHVAGVLKTASGYSVASYWRDSLYRALSDSTIPYGADVTSLHVDDTTILIGGLLWQNSQGVIWQNGKQINIKGASGPKTLVASFNNNLVGVWCDDSLGWVFHKDGFSQPILDTASFFPTALAVSENDLFIAGNAKGYVGTHFDYSNMYAQCWKNGQLIFRESEHSYVSSIFIHRNDVYMAGFLYLVNGQPQQGRNIACYWKNGQRINLEFTNEPNSRATSIFVTDANVYVSGDLRHRVVYWKDGVPNYVPGADVSAHAIFVKGTDVFVAGSENGHPAYWKNKVKQDLANQDKQGWVNFIVVGSD